MQTPRYLHEREIWLVDLEPTCGIELRKIRPAVILRKFSRQHFVILPLTSKSKSEQNSVLLENISFLVAEKNWMNLPQIRVADISRFKRRFGKISPIIFTELKKKTAEALRLPPQGHSDHNVR